MRNTFHSDNLICGSEFIFFLHLNGDSDILYIVVLKHERKKLRRGSFSSVFRLSQRMREKERRRCKRRKIRSVFS